MRDEEDVGAEGFACEAEFDELDWMFRSPFFLERVIKGSYLLLLHQFRIGTVVDDTPAEDGGGERGVNLLSANILQLAIQDEIIALRTEKDSRLLAEQNKSEDITVLISRNPISI